MNNKIKIKENSQCYYFKDSNKKFYTPENDTIFRSIFGSSGNESITKALLQGLLQEEIPQICLNANPEITRKHVLDKKQTVDVKVLCPNSKQTFIIEMQNKANYDDPRRFSTYLERIHTDGLRQGKSYTELDSITLIIILSENYKQFENLTKYHTIWNSREETFSDYIFCKDATIHLFELTKYIDQKNNAQKNNEKFIINPWLEFFINPFGKEVVENMRSQEELRLAVDLLKKLNEDDEVRTIASEEEFWEFDRIAQIKGAEEKGMAEVLLKFIQYNMSKEEIAKALGCSMEELENIIKKYTVAT